MLASKKINMSLKQNAIEFIGKTLNNLTILEDLGNPRNGDRKVLAKCICGTIKEYFLFNIKSAKSTSCGCIKNPFKTHGLSNHKLYRIYYGILDRCYNVKSAVFSYYGGRGVVMCNMCNEWLNNFSNFYDWAIKNGWKDGLELDKDIKGNGLVYSPDACLFVTAKQNCNKRRSSKLIEYKGEIKTASEWSDVYNISQQTFYKRRKRGLDIKTCLEMPLHKNQFAAKC